MQNVAQMQQVMMIAVSTPSGTQTKMPIDSEHHSASDCDAFSFGK
jgi:hypothetical protein